MIGLYWVGHMRILRLAAAAFLTVSASAPPASAEGDYGGAPYTLNVVRVRVVDDYATPGRPPHVEQFADVTPAEAVRRWSAKRLIAIGRGENWLEVDIQDAGILRKDLPRQKTGIEGFFTHEQTEEYDGDLEIELKIYGPDSPLPAAHIHVGAHQSRTLPDDATMADRDAALRQITADLIGQMNAELDQHIRQYFAPYLL